MARTKRTARTSTGGKAPRPDDFTRPYELEMKARTESHERYVTLANILIDDPNENEVSDLKKSLQSILKNEYSASEDSIRDTVEEMLDDDMKELETKLRTMIIEMRTTIIDEMRTTIIDEMRGMVKSAVLKELQRDDFKKFIAARVEHEMRLRR